MAYVFQACERMFEMQDTELVDTTSNVPSPPLGLPQVLVVEDVDTTRRRMSSALRARGYRVDEAADGAEGLRLLSAGHGRYHAVLLDLLLPQLDGWRFRELQLQDPALARIPTIIVTRRPLREPDRYVLRTQSVILKPFEDESLVTAVATACAAARTNPQPIDPVTPGVDEPSSGRVELFWSRVGEVACRAHAPVVGSERWSAERWTAIPRGAGRDRLTYQCQHCSGNGPIRHRSGADA